MKRQSAAITGGLFCFALVGGLIAADSLAQQAPPSTLRGGAECHAKDANLFGQNEKDSNDWIKKYENFNEDALRQSSLEKYCKWLTDAVLPVKARILARLEARMTDECGFDPIVSSQRDYAAWQLIALKRSMSGPCLGVKNE